MKETMSFNVKFYKTDNNILLFEDFKDFANKHTSDSYLKAIELLLNSYDLLMIVKKERINNERELERQSREED